MSNETFFLEICNRGYLTLLEKKPKIENNIKVYLFTYYGHSSINKIRFNQVGGYIDCEVIKT